MENSVSERFSVAIREIVAGHNDPLSQIEEAAIFVIFAIEGQKYQGRLSAQAKSAYSYRYKYQIIYRIAAWLLIVIHFFQRPKWTFYERDWNNGALFPSSGIYYLPNTVAIILNTICLVTLSVAVMQDYIFEQSATRRRLMYLMALTILLKFIETFVSFVLFCIGKAPVFSVSPVEILCVILIERKYVSNIIYLVRIMPAFVGIIVFLASVIMVYTAYGYLVFEPGSSEINQYFPSYGVAIWNMMMVLNGSNWPPPMIPAYCQNRLYVFYFMVYLILANWGILNLTLGFIFTLFQIERDLIHQKVALIRESNLRMGFSLLDPLQRGYIGLLDVSNLLEYLYLKFETKSSPPSVQEYMQLALLLDINGDHRIVFEGFKDIQEKCLGGALNSLRSKLHFDQMFSSSSFSSKSSRSFSRGESFNGDAPSRNSNSEVLKYARKSITAPNNVNVSLDDSEHMLDIALGGEIYHKMSFSEVMAMPPPENTIDLLSRVARIIDSVEFDVCSDIAFLFLGALMLSLNKIALLYIIFVFSALECLLKMIVKGVFRFKKSYRNSFNALITVLLFLCLFGSDLYASNQGGYRYAVNAIVIIRIIFFPRNLFVIKQLSTIRQKYQRGFEYAVTGAGDLLFLLLILFGLMYSFACIGQQLFGGLIRKFGENLEYISSSYYGVSGYWPLNFNDMPSGFATMFVLLHVNNMHVTSSGFSSVIGKSAEIFFALFYCLGVLLLLNVVTAFVLTRLLDYISIQAAAREQERIQQEDSHRETMSFKLQQPGLPTIAEEDEKALSDFDKTPKKGEVISPLVSEKSLRNTENSDQLEERESLYNRANRFSTSIYANADQRRQLNEWIQSSFREYQERYQQEQSIRSTIAQQDSTRLSDTKLNQRDSKDMLSDLDATNLSSHHQRAEKFATMQDWISGKVHMKPFESAAVLIQCARDGGHYTLFSSHRALTCYKIRHKFALFFRVCSWALMLMRIFERPLWTFYNSNWQDDQLYPKFGIPFIPPKLALILKLPIVISLFIGLMLEHGYKENGSFQFTKFSLMTFMRYLMMTYSLVQLLLLFSVACGLKKDVLVLISSCGCALYLFWFDKRSMLKLRFVISVIPQLWYLLGAFAVIVLLFAVCGPYIFGLDKVHRDDDFNQSQFQTFSDSIWSVFVAITSSSYPGQVMPLYRDFRLFFFYFFAFICLGSYGVLNLILVVVLYEYNKAVQKQADEAKAARQVLLLKAFEIMDNELHRGYLDYSQVKQVLHELYSNYTDFRKAGIPSEAKQDLLVQILDFNGDGMVGPDEFTYLIDVTRIKLKQSTDITYMKTYFPTFTERPLVQRVFKLVLGDQYNIIFDIIVSAIIITDLVKSPNLYADFTEEGYFEFHSILVVLLILDIALKHMSLGHRVFKRKFRYRATTYLTMGYFVSLMMSIFSFRAKNHIVFRVASVLGQIIEIIRLIMFVRNIQFFMSRDSFALLNVAVKRIVRSIYTLSVVFIGAFYLFTTLGMFLYGGKINKLTTSPHYQDLLDSQYGLNGFYSLNFNDMLSGFVTLFSCLHVSDFDVITSGFVAVTSNYSRIFFTVWYVIGVLVLLNIVKSYFLNEDFIAAMTAAMGFKKLTEAIRIRSVSNVREKSEFERQISLTKDNPVLSFGNRLPSQDGNGAAAAKAPINLENAIEDVWFKLKMRDETFVLYSSFVPQDQANEAPKQDASVNDKENSTSSSSFGIIKSDRFSTDSTQPSTQPLFKKYTASTQFLKEMSPEDFLMLKNRLEFLSYQSTKDMHRSISQINLKK